MDVVYAYSNYALTTPKKESKPEISNELTIVGEDSVTEMLCSLSRNIEKQAEKLKLDVISFCAS